MSKPEPVPRRQVALGNGDEAREARFRGQQVVAAFVQGAVANHEADGQEQALLVQEETELHRQRHFPRRAADGRNRVARSSEEARSRWWLAIEPQTA